MVKHFQSEIPLNQGKPLCMPSWPIKYTHIRITYCRQTLSIQKSCFEVTKYYTIEHKTNF